MFIFFRFTGSKLIASATQLASQRYALLRTYLQPGMYVLYESPLNEYEYKG